MAVFRKKERKDLHRMDMLGGYKTINERISRISETRWTLVNGMRKNRMSLTQNLRSALTPLRGFSLFAGFNSFL